MLPKYKTRQRCEFPSEIAIWLAWSRLSPPLCGYAPAGKNNAWWTLPGLSVLWRGAGPACQPQWVALAAISPCPFCCSAGLSSCGLTLLLLSRPAGQATPGQKLGQAPGWFGHWAGVFSEAGWAGRAHSACSELFLRQGLRGGRLWVHTGTPQLDLVLLSLLSF